MDFDLENWDFLAPMDVTTAPDHAQLNLLSFGTSSADQFG